MSFLALCLKKILGTSFVFDTRGFWVDERRESGQWTKKSITYKILKKIEARLFSTADVVVSLTQAGAISMSELTTAPVSVVPTCVDTTIFRLRDPGPKPYVMGYFGSTGLWYSFEPVVHLFKAIKTIRPESRMIVLTRDPAGPLKKMFENTASSVDFGQADRVGVAEAMNQVLLSPFFFRPFESKVASAPTRFAELLARGLPVVTNGICGDLAAAIQSEPSLGFCIDVEKVDWPKLAEMVLLLAENNVLDKERRIFVEKNFSLDRGVAEYKRIWGSFA